MFNWDRYFFKLFLFLTIFQSYTSYGQKGNPKWYVQNTGTNHTILIPEWANITIDDDTISVGDFIGVFFDSSGFSACGGYLKWEGGNSAISAWGSEEGNDGFESGEEFKWKIWDATKDIEFSAIAIFNEIDFPNGSQYHTNGISGISELDGYIFETQQLILEAGWDLYSINTKPFENSTEVLFSDISGNLIIAKNIFGEIFFPSGNVHSISNLNYTDVLIVKMETTDTLKIQGRKVKPEFHQIALNYDWNLIPYLRHANAAIAEVFSNFYDKFFLLKDGAGKVFCNYYHVSDLKNLEVGKAYNLYSEFQENFFYVSDTIEFEEFSYENISCKHFVDLVKTDYNQTVIILETAIDSFAQENDEFGVFNENGKLVGSQIYIGGNISITVWENDTVSQENDGIFDNQKFIVKHWSSANQIEEWLIVENFVSGSDIYKRNQISVVDKISLSGTDETQAFSILNLQNGEIQIDFFISENSLVKLYLFNIEGKLVEKIVENNLQAGKFQKHLNIKKFQSGVYFIYFSSLNNSDSKIFVII
ncbi:MAG: T9SS type A sorting domain-containing protein [Bacteroidetes bacterium]|jgi:hypothetical protein|nr:T9SS type A sorting domain-containing protein [Bacteroidota bacterium]MBT6687308.1 T9SS type A sorting domain-containing protein [Bacteroidota bacterium]MBT7143972.1 T9SS type A sorting domain-containing protein [Bacteroidota bacterium]MBT7491115.1 T9SS type A sorting domain-containing protein [Bacteroidota bacterium]